MNPRTESQEIKFLDDNNKVIVGLIVAGIVALVCGWILDAKRTWVAFLLTNVYFVTLSVSALFFIALQYITGSRWSIIFRRVPEAISRTIVPFSLSMLTILFGAHSLYHWADEHGVQNDKVLQAKAGYLNVPFFFIRMAIILGLWVVFSKLFYRLSKKEDVHGGDLYHQKSVKVSAIFIIVFAVSISISGFDWIMSLDPHWFSTIFAIYNFSGMFVNALAVITLVSIILLEMGKLPMLKEDHIHDLGKLIFAFTFFWAYIWYSQYVLIWYGNIPEETVYYVDRSLYDWNWLFYFNFIVNFVIPFFVLLPRSMKRNSAMVKRVCILLLVGRWLDLYVMVAPGVLHDHANIGLIEVFVALGFGGTFILLLKKQLSKMPLVPFQSPYIEDSIHHHQ